MTLAATIKVKRAYAPPSAEDGRRILVDRLWPRGLRKSDAAIEDWRKELAPSTALRKWFGHDPARWAEFCARYGEELRTQTDLVQQMRRLAGESVVTLLYAAHDDQHNNAVALRRVLLGRS